MTVPSADKVVMLDASFGLDRIDRKFSCQSPSPAGSMHIGTIVCSSKSEAVLTEHKSILLSTAFHGHDVALVDHVSSSLIMQKQNTKHSQNIFS